MLSNLFVFTIALGLPPLDSPATRPAHTPKPPPPADMIAANEAAERFVQALRESQWSKALALCSPEAEKESRQYSSPEAFMHSVVPCERLIRETKLPIYAWNPMGGSWGLGAPALKLAELAPDPSIPWPISTWSTVYWQWHMKKTDTGWVVDFPTTAALKNYTEKQLAELRSAREKLVAKEKELEPILRGVHTRLTIQERRIQAGRPLPLRLELVNEGPAQLLYDDSAVRYWTPMTVRNARGETIPSSRGPSQIGMPCKLLKPGEAILLDNWDLTGCYRLKEPGRYTVQFSGNGLGISETDPNKTQLISRSPRGRIETLPGYGRRSSRLFPSNVVEIEVVATQPAGI